MKSLAALFLFTTLTWAGLENVRAEKVVTKAAALSAIEVFEKDPSSKEGFAAGETVMAYAKSNSTVDIYLSKTVVPWIKDKDASDADTRNMLVMAYVVGNLHSQLTKGQPTDDVYAGWQQVLFTYAQLQQINPTVKLSEIDDLKAKEKEGTLRAYASEMSAKNTKR